jgi:hypothetical protein
LDDDGQDVRTLWTGRATLAKRGVLLRMKARRLSGRLAAAGVREVPAPAEANRPNAIVTTILIWYPYREE